ncbi:uncharacterized protein LOC127259699 [Andrographis paniculata]|uniref:uncharacterized protein LOC127259699 n=1 Tax=Andrographis paniculata TaxID=175694 RepID=UPI0021E8A4B9|nr:uncharacterized protein LOC127259699 [Andrographis paniculata]
MAGWSAEKATKAYLESMEMQGQVSKEPDAAEFISAMVAGASARLIVVACADAAEPTVSALAAAAHHTAGKVVCILHELGSNKTLAPSLAKEVEFVVGNAEWLITSDYVEADCVVVNCRIRNSERILKAARSAIVFGYNAVWTEPSRLQEFDARLLPIGEGLLLNRTGETAKRARWVVKVDRLTGEEHIFRLRANPAKTIFSR